MRCTSTRKRVCVRAAAIKRKTEQERFVWDELDAVSGTPWKPTPAAQQGEKCL